MPLGDFFPLILQLAPFDMGHASTTGPRLQTRSLCAFNNCLAKKAQEKKDAKERCDQAKLLKEMA